MNLEVDPMRLLQLFTIVAIAIGITFVVFMPGGVLELLTHGVGAGVDALWPLTGAALVLVGGFGMVFRWSAMVVAGNRVILTDDGIYVVCVSMFPRRAHIVPSQGARDDVVRAIAAREAWRPLLPLLGFAFISIFIGWPAGILFALVCEMAWVLVQRIALESPAAGLEPYRRPLSYKECRRGRLRLVSSRDCQVLLLQSVFLAALPAIVLAWSVASGVAFGTSHLAVLAMTMLFAGMGLLAYRRSRWRMTDSLACYPPPLPPAPTVR